MHNSQNKYQQQPCNYTEYTTTKAIADNVMLTIEDLKRMRPVLNLTEIARRAGINENSLLAKVRRGSELTVPESQRIQDALHGVGLAFKVG